MRIERIEKSKHKQERVLVFLEGWIRPLPIDTCLEVEVRTGGASGTAG